MKFAFFVMFIISDLLLTATHSFADEPATNRINTNTVYQDVQMFANTLTYLQRVSVKKDEQKKYLYAALQSMTEALDRYSYFVPPDLMGFFYEEHKNRYIGIGLHLARSSDGSSVEIMAVENDSPAQKKGVEPGDLIMAIDGKPTRNLRLVDAVRAIRSPGLAEGSKINLLIQKAGDKNPSEISLSRAFIKPAVSNWKILEKGYGYVNIFSFNESTVPDFKKTIQEMEAQGGKLKGVIIDLRNNPGGEVVASVELARLFIDNGIIAFLANKLDDATTVYRAYSTRLYEWPIAIIVDKGTASAAELFAGALQIHKRAVLIGKKTFGKGVFQSLVPLSSDSGLYITLGSTYLPDGTSIDGTGLTPDVLFEQGTTEQNAIGKSLDILKSYK